MPRSQAWTNFILGQIFRIVSSYVHCTEVYLVQSTTCSEPTKSTRETCFGFTFWPRTNGGVGELEPDRTVGWTDPWLTWFGKSLWKIIIFWSIIDSFFRMWILNHLSCHSYSLTAISPSVMFLPPWPPPHYTCYIARDQPSPPQLEGKLVSCSEGRSIK